MKAKERLRAARFFLNGMEDVLEDRTAFVHNLLAFLMISRSVTWILQKEFDSNPKFKKWYEKKQEEMQKDHLMTFFKEMRNVAVKEMSPQIKTRKSITFTADVVLVDSLSVKLTKADGTEVQYESPPPKAFAYANPESKVPVLIGYYFIDWPEDDDVISLCEKYLEKLENIVSEANNVSS